MKREGKKEGGGEILEVGKGARDVAEWQRIENTKQRRDKRDGMDKGVAYASE